MKGDAKYRNSRWFGWLVVTQVYQQCRHSIGNWIYVYLVLSVVCACVCVCVCVCVTGVLCKNGCTYDYENKKHLKNVGPIRHCEPPHAALPFTRCRYCHVARRLRIDVYNDYDDDDDNAWQRGPLWPHGMGPAMPYNRPAILVSCQRSFKPIANSHANIAWRGQKPI